MITIITFGIIKQQELAQLQEIYMKRLATMPSVRIKVLPIKANSNEAYEEKIRKLADEPNHTLLLLSENAKEYTSHEFCELITPSLSENQSYTFVLGPPEGFSSELKKSCQQISLSPMTFPHEVAQVLLIEQIYRAACIYHGKNYHK